MDENTDGAKQAPVWRIVGASNNFDALRWLLACLVLVSHCWLILRGGASWHLSEPLLVLTNGQRDMGSLAVDCFFALSGALISVSYTRSRSLRDYAVKRIKRIYPGFVVAALATWLFAGYFLAVPSPHTSIASWNWSDFLSQAALLKRIEVTGAGTPLPGLPGAVSLINSSTWTVRHEAVAYALCSVLGAMGLFKRERRWLLVALWCAVLVGQASFGSKEPEIPATGGWFFDTLPNFLSPPWPRLIASFLAGAVFVTWQDRIPRDRRLAFAACGVLLATMAAGAWFHIAFCIVGTYLMFYVGSSQTLRLHRWAEWVGGDYSYGLYLTAWPTSVAVAYYLPPLVQGNPLILALISLPLATLAAAASWHLVERRFLSRAAKRKPELGVDATSTGSTRARAREVVNVSG